jgi:hypothetical protein
VDQASLILAAYAALALAAYVALSSLARLLGG